MARSYKTILAGIALGVGLGGTSLADTVYTASNAPEGNEVLRFDQSADGVLQLVAAYPTGGLGSGGGLGNQGAIAADEDFLYVIDAGSDEVSVLRFDDASLELVDRVSSGGIRPVSLSVDRGILYVVNAGSDNIAGFEVSAEGQLEPIPGSVQSLSTTGTAPAQISFSKDGRTLIVTEKATQRVVTFVVDRNGAAGPATAFDSPGATPFGFALTSGRRVLVSEAAGGAANASSVTSWKLSPDGELAVLDPVAPTLQSAACWVAVTPNGRFAYTTNTASGSVSAFRIQGDRLINQDADGVAASAGDGSAPIDMSVTPDGRFLHTLNTGTDTITTFRIANDGSLDPVASIGNIPDRATGLLVR